MATNTISLDFSNPAILKAAMEKYGDRKDMLFGENTNGEKQDISIAYDSIILTTYQNNGYIRKNEYNADGLSVCETYEGRWR